MLPAIFLMMGAQYYVNSTYRKWGKVSNRSRLTGAEAAQRLIQAGRLNNVRVEAVAGKLSDHYDPRQKVLRLSQGVYQNKSVAAVAIAAHELGHAMHSHYSDKNQPYATAGYALFVAEVASTFNENLLLDYLMKNTDDDKQKLVLLDQWINNFLGTVFTQVIFGEFERNAHKMVQDGDPITVESLNKIVHDSDVKWYGDVATLDEGYSLNWGRISHYYRTFYVYKYATSFCASTALARSVLDGEEGAIEKYMTFLQSGGNDYPIEILKKAGVDMSSPEPVEQAMQLFDSLVIQMEELLLNQ